MIQPYLGGKQGFDNVLCAFSPEYVHGHVRGAPVLRDPDQRTVNVVQQQRFTATLRWVEARKDRSVPSGTH